MTVIHTAVGEAKKRLCTDDGDLFVQREVTRKSDTKHANMVRRRDSVRLNLQRHTPTTQR